MRPRTQNSKDPESFSKTALAERGKTLLSGICSKCEEVYWSFGSKGYCSNRCARFKHGTWHGYKIVARTPRGGKIYEHRVVAGAGHGMIVHHKNGNKLDNRPENLEVMTPSQHCKLHNTEMHDARWRRVPVPVEVGGIKITANLDGVGA